MHKDNPYFKILSNMSSDIKDYEKRKSDEALTFTMMKTIAFEASEIEKSISPLFNLKICISRNLYDQLNKKGLYYVAEENLTMYGHNLEIVNSTQNELFIKVGI